MRKINTYETFGKRFVAGIIDSLVFLPLSIVNIRMEDTDSKTLFICWTLFYIFCWLLYVVIGHGKYGQTVGKKLMQIKVFDLEEQHPIGYKKAFIRESIWLLVDISGIIYLVMAGSDGFNGSARAEYTTLVGVSSAGWLLLEMATMFLHPKRRALHDLIAGSVVVDIQELKREKMQKQHKDLVNSLQNS